MHFSSYIAVRYLKSKQLSKSASFITTISIGGIGLGVAIVIVALTIFDGFNNAITEKIIQMDSHIKITGFGGRKLPDSDNFIKSLKSRFPNRIVNINPFINAQSLIKSKKQTEGVTLQGINNMQLNSLKRYIISQTKPFSKNEQQNNQIIIGKKLAERLFLKAGDTVTLFALQKPVAPSEDNPPIIEKFTVGAVYESGMAEYDDLIAYITFKSAQEMFSLKDEVSGYDIQLKT